MDRCLICRITGVFLVRDHDHATGYIRGLLCEKCNSWLGTLENHPDWYYRTQDSHKRGQFGSKKSIWRKWVYHYAAEIWEHMNRNTGILYMKHMRSYYLSHQHTSLGLTGTEHPSSKPKPNPGSEDGSHPFNQVTHGDAAELGPPCESQRGVL